MSEEIQDLVYTLAVSPNFAQGGSCFAARVSGLYRSDDGGSTWYSAYDSLNLEATLATTTVAISPSFESDRTVFAGTRGGILRSIDGGENWTSTLLPSPPPLVSVIVVSPDFAQDGVLLVGTTEDGVFRSADQGRHLYRWNFGLLDLSVFSMAISPSFADDETLFVGTETGIFRSTNGGRAWREVNFPTEFAPVLSLAISPDYANDGILFAGTESCGLFQSSDRGSTWNRLAEDVVQESVNGILLSPEFPAKPEILILGERLLVSRDGGQSWTKWKKDIAFEEMITAITAPQGLDPDMPLLVGFVGGAVRRL